MDNLKKVFLGLVFFGGMIWLSATHQWVALSFFFLGMIWAIGMEEQFGTKN